MDRRKAWRDEEEQLVARWNAATEQFRTLQEEMSRQPPAESMSDELKRKMQEAHTEMEALRRRVARIKVEFSTGKRY